MMVVHRVAGCVLVLSSCASANAESSQEDFGMLQIHKMEMGDSTHEDCSKGGCKPTVDVTAPTPTAITPRGPPQTVNLANTADDGVHNKQGWCEVSDSANRLRVIGGTRNAIGSFSGYGAHIGCMLKNDFKAPYGTGGMGDKSLKLFDYSKGVTFKMQTQSIKNHFMTNPRYAWYKTRPFAQDSGFSVCGSLVPNHIDRKFHGPELGYADYSTGDAGTDPVQPKLAHGWSISYHNHPHTNAISSFVSEYRNISAYSDDALPKWDTWISHEISLKIDDDDENHLVIEYWKVGSMTLDKYSGMKIDCTTAKNGKLVNGKGGFGLAQGYEDIEMKDFSFSTGI